MTNFSRAHILLKSAFHPKTGYGNDGISIASHLMDMNADVHIDPRWVGIPLPVNIAMLFAKERYEDKLDLIIDHLDPEQLGLLNGYVENSRACIAWTMWEFTGFGQSNEWVKSLEERLSPFDLVLAYDEVSRQALSSYVDDKRLHILQGGYESSLWQPEENQERDWDSTFRFAMVGALNRRKNPFAAINAFNLLKKEYGDEFDAELHLKTNMLGLHPAMEQAYPGLHIHLVLWTQPELKEFYAGINCLLAPSWGEGKNLPALEAQTMGVPVIATDFGGHRQWLGDDWSYSVTGPIEEHEDGMGSIRVSTEDLAEKMWYVYTHRYEAKEKGYKASQIIPQMCDWGKVLERLGTKLQDLKLI